MNGSNGLLLYENICIVTKFNIDLLQSSIIALLTYVGVYVTSVLGDKICMMTTRLACNRAIETSYWRMDNDPDVGLLTGYVLYRLPVELEFMDLNTFPR
jgi:hypothetical protein